MKFNCPKCKKEFSLSDKLKGKTLKVRCTSCGSAFKMKVVARAQHTAASKPLAKSTARFHPDSAAKVKEEVARAEAKAEAEEARRKEAAAPKLTVAPPVARPAPPVKPPPPVEPPPPPLEARPVKWYAIIDKKRLGPMPFRALTRLVTDGKVNADTNVWRKGMKAWEGAGKIDELGKVFAALPPPAPPPKPAPVEEKAALKPSADPAQPRSDESAPWELSTPFNDPASAEEIAKVLQVTEGDATGAEPPPAEDVEISTLDASFFDSAPKVADLSRGADQIVLLDGPAFPVEMDEHHVDKDARASLKDFSVMVRLSRRNRTKQVGLLIGLGAVAVAALFAIFTFGDPLAVFFPDKEIHDSTQEGFKGLFSEAERRQMEQRSEKQAENVEQKAAPENQESNADELLKSMQDGEWTVSLGEDDLELDKERFASKLKEKKTRHKSAREKSHGKPAEKRNHGDDEEDDEVSLSEFVASEGRKAKTLDGSKIAGAGGDKTEKVVDGMDSSMGKLLGGPSHLKERKVDASVAKRKGDGSALRALVAKRVSQKVRGKRKHLQRCVEDHGGGYAGSGASLRANLHFTEKGEVRRVTIKGGNQELEACFQEAFTGWRISMVNRKIKIPISVRFQ